MTLFRQVLRRYSDKTIAMDYVKELESYTADTPDYVLSGKYLYSHTTRSTHNLHTQGRSRGPAHPAHPAPVHLLPAHRVPATLHLLRPM